MDWYKVFSAIGATVVTGVFGVVLSWVTKWKIDDLRSGQLQRAVNDRRELAEEQDKILAALRDQLQISEQRVAEMGIRQKCLEDQLIELSGERVQDKRQIRSLTRELRQRGLPLPPEEQG